MATLIIFPVDGCRCHYNFEMISRRIETMTSRNFDNRTIWTGDCLHIMRGMNSETVDLIYVDPSFDPKADYATLDRGETEWGEFKDTWTLRDVNEEALNLIVVKHPALRRVLLAGMTDSDKAYLAYMAERLLEMHRVLKSSGSIYLHCPSTMSYHLKLVMDAIFGKKNLRREIVWRHRANGTSENECPERWDILLLYGKDTCDSSQQGERRQDCWEIDPVSRDSKEWTGYDGQKPLALLKRVILSSSGEGDMVLDPFCGCVTALVVAEKCGREWVGIDISTEAVKQVIDRIGKDLGVGDGIKCREDAPRRSDVSERLPKPNCAENRRILYGEQEGHCAGCGGHFKLDDLVAVHIVSKPAGTDYVDNLQLLCASCEKRKGRTGIMGFLLTGLEVGVVVNMGFIEIRKQWESGGVRNCLTAIGDSLRSFWAWIKKKILAGIRWSGKMILKIFGRK